MRKGFRIAEISKLERICAEAFCGTSFESFAIPDSVVELCEGCFKECKSLRRVTFGASSSLERIGVSCFEGSGVEEVSVPDCVRELCDDCYQWRLPSTSRHHRSRK